MGAPDLLRWLWQEGLTVQLTDTGGLAVSPAARLTDDHRQAIKTHRAELVAALFTAEKPPSAWTDGEIKTFTERMRQFQRRGITEEASEALGLALLTRDREGLDMRMCLECAGLTSRGRCLPASRGRIAGADRFSEPVPTILMRCEGLEPLKK